MPTVGLGRRRHACVPASPDGMCAEVSPFHDPNRRARRYRADTRSHHKPRCRRVVAPASSFIGVSSGGQDVRAQRACGPRTTAYAKGTSDVPPRRTGGGAQAATRPSGESGLTLAASTASDNPMGRSWGRKLKTLTLSCRRSTARCSLSFTTAASRRSRPTRRAAEDAGVAREVHDPPSAAREHVGKNDARACEKAPEVDLERAPLLVRRNLPPERCGPRRRGGSGWLVSGQRPSWLCAPVAVRHASPGTERPRRP